MWPRARLEVVAKESALLWEYVQWCLTRQSVTINRLCQCQIAPMCIWTKKEGPNNIDSMQFSQRIPLKMKFFKSVVSMCLLTQLFKGTQLLFLPMARLVQEKPTLWWEKKALLPKTVGYPTNMTGFFCNLLGICGNKWQWEMNNSMWRHLFLRFTTSNWEICSIQLPEFFMPDGILKMDFLWRI